MNNKGQALVEFVLVLPVFLLLVFGMIEIGNVIYKKYELEKHIDPVIELYNKEDELVESYENSNGIDINFDKTGNLVTVTISKDIKLITPGLTKFLGNPMNIKATRTFYMGWFYE